MSRHVTTILIAGLLLGSARPGHGQTSYCRTNPDTANFLIGLERLGSTTVDTAYMRSRGYPWARADSITLVTANNTCKAGLAAYNKSKGLSGPRALASAYVLAIGSAGYLVINPLETTGEFTMRYLYDRHWVLKASIAG